MFEYELDQNISILIDRFTILSKKINSILHICLNSSTLQNYFFYPQLSLQNTPSSQVAKNSGKDLACVWHSWHSSGTGIQHVGQTWPGFCRDGTGFKTAPKTWARCQTEYLAQMLNIDMWAIRIWPILPFKMFLSKIPMFSHTEK